MMFLKDLSYDEERFTTLSYEEGQRHEETYSFPPAAGADRPFLRRQNHPVHYHGRRGVLPGKDWFPALQLLLFAGGLDSL